jgi:HK97 family phage major capsid protein
MNTYPASAFAGLTWAQTDRYNLGALIAAAAGGDDGALQFYRSVSAKIEEQTGRPLSTVNSFYIPAEVLQRRDLSAGSGAGGGYLVAGTEVAAFASALFATSITARLPLRRVAMAANAAVAAVTAAPAVTWLSSEAAEAGDAAMAFGARTATPKTVSATQYLSRHLDLSAPGATAFVEQQLGAALAKAIDVAFINGTGASGQPLGLLGLAGTVSQSGTSLAYSAVCTMIAAAEGYGTKPHVLLGKDTAKLLRQRARVTSGSPIFDGGTIDGLPTLVSRAMPDDAMLVLDPTLVSEMRWGTLELTITPLASPTAFQKGLIGVRAVASIDWVTDHAGAIAKSTSIT